MEAEWIANRLEIVIQTELENYIGSSVKKFTPSVVMGRRYIGFIDKNARQFMVELNVEEVHPVDPRD